MRLLWPLLLIVGGTSVFFYASALSQRFDGWMTQLREPDSEPSLAPVAKVGTLRTKIVTVIVRVAGLYVILAGVMGLLAAFFTR